MRNSFDENNSTTSNTDNELPESPIPKRRRLFSESYLTTLSNNSLSPISPMSRLRSVDRIKHLSLGCMSDEENFDNVSLGSADMDLDYELMELTANNTIILNSPIGENVTEPEYKLMHSTPLDNVRKNTNLSKILSSTPLRMGTSRSSLTYYTPLKMGSDSESCSEQTRLMQRSSATSSGSSFMNSTTKSNDDDNLSELQLMNISPNDDKDLKSNFMDLTPKVNKYEDRSEYDRFMNLMPKASSTEQASSKKLMNITSKANQTTKPSGSSVISNEPYVHGYEKLLEIRYMNITPNANDAGIPSGSGMNVTSSVNDGAKPSGSGLMKVKPIVNDDARPSGSGLRNVRRIVSHRAKSSGSKFRNVTGAVNTATTPSGRRVMRGSPLGKVNVAGKQIGSVLVHCTAYGKVNEGKRFASETASSNLEDVAQSLMEFETPRKQPRLRLESSTSSDTSDYQSCGAESKSFDDDEDYYD